METIEGLEANTDDLPTESGEELLAPDSESVSDSDSDGESAPEPALSARVGALLFVSPRPLTIETLADLTRATEDEVQSAVELLQNGLSEEVHGFSLYEVGGAWQMRSGARNARVVQRLIPARARRLSRAAAETLAVVAYKQPVQRAEIEAIRGVDALPTIRTLLDARLIRIVGREATPGQPALYGTTSVFLEKFGLRDLSDLPTVRELVELVEEPGESIEEETFAADQERDAGQFQEQGSDESPGQIAD